jgi:hypothetical protein
MRLMGCGLREARLAVYARLTLRVRRPLEDFSVRSSLPIAAFPVVASRCTKRPARTSAVPCLASRATLAAR